MFGRPLFSVLLAVVLLPVALCAAELGPDVAVYRGQELKWENGQYNYLVLFKSQLANLTTANDTYNGNFCPLPDACIDSAATTLNSDQLPINAQIEKVFLVWSAAQPLAKIDDFTDNTVRLEFFHNSASGLNLGVDIVGREARLTDSQDFEFESYVETVGDTKLGYSVHRVDVTDFFFSLMETGNELGIVDPAASLFGIYAVSGLECTEDRAYRNHAAMLADWSLIFIYYSEGISPQQIYIYNGFHPYRHERVERKLTGFDLPRETTATMTVLTHGGYNGMLDLTESRVPESLELAMPDGVFVPIWDKCNPRITLGEGRTSFTYTEIFSLNSSIWDWNRSDNNGPICSFGVPPGPFEGVPEYAVDVDTFIFDSRDEPWGRAFQCGTKELALAVSTNENRVFTDMVIFSHRIYIKTGPDFWESTCSSIPEENTFCYDTREPFMFAFSVGRSTSFNSSDIYTKNLVITEELPAEVEYVAGSTELAAEVGAFLYAPYAPWDWNAPEWTPLPDGPDGSFPLAQGFPIGELLPLPTPCVDETLRFIVRFMVRPKEGLSADTVIQNMGRLDTEDGWMYSNTSIPLEVHGRACAGAGYGAIDLTKCGGVPPEELADDDAILTDDAAVSDADTNQSDDGCGCSLVF